MYSADEVERKRMMAVKLREERTRNKPSSTAPTSSPHTLNNGKPNSQQNNFLKKANNQSPMTFSRLSNNNQNKQPNHFLKDTNSLGSISSPQPSNSNQSRQPNNLLKRMNNFNPMSAPPPKQAKLVKAIEPASFFSQMNLIKGTYRMVTASRFEVDVPYHQPLIEFFKKFPTKSYDQKSKLWSFDIKEYENFRTELKLKLPQVALVGIPKFVIQTFLNGRANNNATDEDLSRIDRKLWDSLMPFQKEGVAFGIQKKGRCFIADDMGLGKTIQALGIAHYYKDDWPLLIVTPLSVRFQWSEAIFEYLPSIPTQHVHQFINTRDYLGTEKITIVSYDLLHRSIDLFVNKRFGTIILDESHLLKNHKTERTKAVQRLTNHASRIILLSGTPALSRPIELYSQLCLILGSFMRIQEYGVRYCNGTKAAYGWNYSGASNVNELQLLLRCRCLIRRLKTDVLKQLPAKIRRVIMLDPSLIDDSSKEMKKIAVKLQQNSTKDFESHSTMLQLYSASSTQRLRAVRHYVKDLLENDRKFLIFAHHQCVMTAICEVLDGKKVQYIKIDGKTSPQNRKEYVDRFQNCEDCMVAVLSITAANAGITLTAAHFVVFAELYWNPGILVQAEDRVHRIGQNSGVLIQYLVAKKTADDYLWPLIQKKLQFLTTAGLNQDFSLTDAEVSVQEIGNQNEQQSREGTKTQTKMDSFLNISSSSTSSQTSNKLEKLLDENEEDFADVDWDSITFDE